MRSSESCCRQTVGRLALGASLIGFLWMNVMVRTPGGEFDPVGEDSIRAAREAALQIGALAGRRPVAVFWFDGYSVYHINYYLTRAERTRSRTPTRSTGRSGVARRRISGSSGSVNRP